MKLAMITSGFLPLPATKGGAVENLIMNLINKNEKEKKIDFYIFSIFDAKAAKESKKYRNTKFEFIKINCIVKYLDKLIFWFAKNILHKSNSQSYRYIMQRLYYLKKVSKMLKKNEYDKVILENHPTQYLALKWNNNWKKYMGRYYYHCHNEFPGLYGCDEIVKQTNKFICVSNFIGKYLKEKIKIENDKIEILKNAIDTNKICKKITNDEIYEIKNRYKIENHDKILIFTGRIVPEKGVLELVKAYNNIKIKNTKLLILGSALNELDTVTEYQKNVYNLCKKNPNIIFTGFINYDELYKFYSIADIAVLPSLWNDAAPLTVIESLCAGLPIITTNSGGIPEYVNEKCAIILDRRSKNFVNEITINIENLINNPKKIEKMSQESINASKNLTLESYYKNFWECIK